MFGFFNISQKQLALKTSQTTLKAQYEKSEYDLKRAAYSASEKSLKTAMKEHHNLEYAMLYQATPRYAKKMQKITNKK